MAAVLQFTVSCLGVIHHRGHAKLPFGIKQYNGIKNNLYNAVSVTCGRSLKVRRQCLPLDRFATEYAAYVGRDHHQSSKNDKSAEEPALLTSVKEAIQCLRLLSVFLLEQPTQLKYIEWPGFRSTLKTATLTLVLVALLIVALSSTDSTLSYLLALMLRRKP